MLDRVGVLSNIAYVLYDMDISLIKARVLTMGERVEDVFLLMILIINLSINYSNLA